MEKIKNNINIFTYLFLAILTILPFFNPGFITMHDNTQVARVLEMGKELSNGNFPVRFVSDLGYGMGYPIFNFYAPLPYYIGGLLNIFFFTPLVATKLTFIFAIILSGIGMYIFVKNIYGNLAGFASSVIYLYFPYHAANIYVRGDLAEIFAYAFMPFVFLGFYNIYKKIDEKKHSETLKWSIVSILSFSAVILSHNLTAFMSMFFILPFLFFQFIFAKRKKVFLYINLLVFLSAFLVTSFYTLPAIFEMKYTNVLSQIGGGANFSDHFICPIQFWDSPWGFGGSAKGCIDGISFRLGKINIIMLFLALAMFAFSKKRHVFVGLFLFLTFFSIFLTTEFSSFIWGIPYMDFLQYPWRFLNFTSFFFSTVVGFLINVAKKEKKLGLISVSFIIALTVFGNLKLFVPQGYEYIQYNDPKYLRWTASKVSDEYLPKNIIKPKNINEIPESDFEIFEGEGNIKNLISTTKISKAEILLNSDSVIRVNRSFFPGRQILVNQKITEFENKNNGLYFPLKKGNHDIETKITNTQIQTFGNTLSLVGAASVLIGIIFLTKTRNKLFN